MEHGLAGGHGFLATETSDDGAAQPPGQAAGPAVEAAAGTGSGSTPAVLGGAHALSIQLACPCCSKNNGGCACGLSLTQPDAEPTPRPASGACPSAACLLGTLLEQCHAAAFADAVQGLAAPFTWQLERMVYCHECKHIDWRKAPVSLVALELSSAGGKQDLVQLLDTWFEAQPLSESEACQRCSTAGQLLQQDSLRQLPEHLVIRLLRSSTQEAAATTEVSLPPALDLAVFVSEHASQETQRSALYVLEGVLLGPQQQQPERKPCMLLCDGHSGWRRCEQPSLQQGEHVATDSSGSPACASELEQRALVVVYKLCSDRSRLQGLRVGVPEMRCREVCGYGGRGCYTCQQQALERQRQQPQQQQEDGQQVPGADLHAQTRQQQHLQERKERHSCCDGSAAHDSSRESSPAEQQQQQQLHHQGSGGQLAHPSSAPVRPALASDSLALPPQSQPLQRPALPSSQPQQQQQQQQQQWQRPSHQLQQQLQQMQQMPGGAAAVAAAISAVAAAAKGWHRQGQPQQLPPRQPNASATESAGPLTGRVLPGVGSSGAGSNAGTSHQEQQEPSSSALMAAAASLMAAARGRTSDGGNASAGDVGSHADDVKPLNQLIQQQEQLQQEQSFGGGNFPGPSNMAFSHTNLAANVGATGAAAASNAAGGAGGAGTGSATPPIRIVCNKLEGLYYPDTVAIEMDGVPVPLPPTYFEVQAGAAKTKKWRESIKALVHDNPKMRAPSLGAYLANRGLNPTWAESRAVHNRLLATYTLQASDTRVQEGLVEAAGMSVADAVGCFVAIARVPSGPFFMAQVLSEGRPPRTAAVVFLEDLHEQAVELVPGCWALISGPSHVRIVARDGSGPPPWERSRDPAPAAEPPPRPEDVADEVARRLDMIHARAAKEGLVLPDGFITNMWYTTRKSGTVPGAKDWTYRTREGRSLRSIGDLIGALRDYHIRRAGHAGAMAHAAPAASDSMGGATTSDRMGARASGDEYDDDYEVEVPRARQPSAGPLHHQQHRRSAGLSAFGGGGGGGMPPLDSQKLGELAAAVGLSGVGELNERLQALAAQLNVGQLAPLRRPSNSPRSNAAANAPSNPTAAASLSSSDLANAAAMLVKLGGGGSGAAPGSSNPGSLNTLAAALAPGASGSKRPLSPSAVSPAAKRPASTALGASLGQQQYNQQQYRGASAAAAAAAAAAAGPHSSHGGDAQGLDFVAMEGVVDALQEVTLQTLKWGGLMVIARALGPEAAADLELLRSLEPLMGLLPTQRLLELLLRAWDVVGRAPDALRAMLGDVMQVRRAALEGLLDRDLNNTDNFASLANAVTLGHAVAQECTRRSIPVPDLITGLTLLAACDGDVGLAVTAILLMHKYGLNKPAAVWVGGLYRGDEARALAAGALVAELLRAAAAAAGARGAAGAGAASE